MGWKSFAFGSAAFAALTAVLAKLGVSEVSSNLATFIRTIVILAVSAIFVTVNREWSMPSTLSQKGLTLLVLSGVATGLSWLCYFRALQLGPVSQVAPIDKLSVVFVVVAGFLMLGEPMSPKVIVGTLLVFAGVVVMAS